MKKLLFIAMTVAVFSSCKKDEHNGANGIFKGPESDVHGGKAWTWVKVDKNGNPEKMAITIDDQALNSVPVGSGDAGHAHGGANSWSLKFHPKVGDLFNHVGLNWNPVGHEPETIYGKPHFDFHFYMMTPAQVAAIPPYEVDSLKFKNWPTPEYFPQGYFNAGGGVPQMGAHWIDPTSSEFQGQPFTETFIYGSYEGKVTFYEPMITLEFLKSANNYQRNIPQPAKVQRSGWYPTKMNVVKHDGLTEVVLSDLAYRQKS